MNKTDIIPEMINCAGCRIAGVKFPYCDSMCIIRQCAMRNDYETCGACQDVKSCDKVSMIIGNNEEARRNLNL